MIMKLKRILMALCVLLVVAAVGVSAVSTLNGEPIIPDEPVTDEQQAAPEEEFRWREDAREALKGMMEDFQGEMSGRMAEAQERLDKWAALTDEQLGELTGLRDQMVDKCLEFGLIDEEEAAKLKEAETMMGGCGIMGGFGGMGGSSRSGRRFDFGGGSAPQDGQTTDSNAPTSFKGM